MKQIQSIEPNIRLDNNLNNLVESVKIIASQDVSLDFVSMFVGSKISNGVYRDVYNYNLNPKLVIKIEPDSTSSNMSEYLVWNEVRGLAGNLAWVKEWFAPVYLLSPNGKILLMEKTQPKPGKKRPDRIPSFFHDAHENNFGWIGNKFVCHDYGEIYGFLKYGKQFEKARWA